MPVVVAERCPQNHPCPCVALSPIDAIRQRGFEAPVIDKDKSIQCSICTEACPYQAITGRLSPGDFRPSS